MALVVKSRDSTEVVIIDGPRSMARGPDGAWFKPKSLVIGDLSDFLLVEGQRGNEAVERSPRRGTVLANAQGERMVAAPKSIGEGRARLWAALQNRGAGERVSQRIGGENQQQGVAGQNRTGTAREPLGLAVGVRAGAGAASRSGESLGVGHGGSGSAGST